MHYFLSKNLWSSYVPFVNFEIFVIKLPTQLTVMLCLALWFYYGMFCAVMPRSLFPCFSVLFSIVITSLGEERES